MGTNFYIKEDPCDKCGRSDNEIHIGKSSMGWKFLFAYNGGEYYKNVPQMKRWLKGKEIRDEYNRVVTNKEFWELVSNKQKNYSPSTEELDTHSMNIDGYRFMDGEFS